MEIIFMKRKILITTLMSFSILWSGVSVTNAKAVYVTGGKLDNVSSVANVANVNTVDNAVINLAQYQELIAQLASIDASVRGQIAQMSGSLQEVLKFNNTSLIESMKDIEKSKKIIETKERLSSVSKTLCDEPGIAAGYQTAIKAGGKIQNEFTNNVINQILDSDELEIKKKIAQMQLKGTKPEEAYADTLDERGTVHYLNKVMTQNQTYAMPKVDENFNYSDPNAKLSLEYERNKKTYELARKSQADADFLKKHTALMPITEEIEKMMKNIGIDPKDPKYKDGKISIIEFLDIKASQFTADANKSKEDLTRDETASLSELIRLMSYQLHLQIYQTKILERIQDKLLETPTGTENKTNLVQ